MGDFLFWTGYLIIALAISAGAGFATKKIGEWRMKKEEVEDKQADET